MMQVPTWHHRSLLQYCCYIPFSLPYIPVRQQFLTLDQRINWWASKGPWVPWILCKQIFILMERCIGLSSQRGRTGQGSTWTQQSFMVSPNPLQTSRSVLTTILLQFCDATNLAQIFHPFLNSHLLNHHYMITLNKFFFSVPLFFATWLQIPWGRGMSDRTLLSLLSA